MSTRRPRFWSMAAGAVLTALLLPACGSSQPYVWASTLRAPTVAEQRALRPGDRLQIVVIGQDAMSGEFEIRPEGDLMLPSVGRVPAAGLQSEQLTATLTARLRGVLADPRVQVSLVSRRPPSVSVLGEVRNPGRFDLKDGEGPVDALARAGGLTPFADPDAVFVVRRGESWSRARFRYRDLTSQTGVGFVLKDGDVVVVE